MSSFKKGGKIQTGLNCEYDGLSEVILTLSHSSSPSYFVTALHSVNEKMVNRPNG